LWKDIRPQLRRLIVGTLNLLSLKHDNAPDYWRLIQKRRDVLLPRPNMRLAPRFFNPVGLKRFIRESRTIGPRAATAP
jgi:hypothetical protein